MENFIVEFLEVTGVKKKKKKGRLSTPTIVSEYIHVLYRSVHTFFAVSQNAASCHANRLNIFSTLLTLSAFSLVGVAFADCSRVPHLILLTM